MDQGTFLNNSCAGSTLWIAALRTGSGRRPIRIAVAERQALIAVQQTACGLQHRPRRARRALFALQKALFGPLSNVTCPPPDHSCSSSVPAGNEGHGTIAGRPCPGHHRPIPESSRVAGRVSDFLPVRRKSLAAALTALRCCCEPRVVPTRVSSARTRAGRQPPSSNRAVTRMACPGCRKEARRYDAHATSADREDPFVASLLSWINPPI